MEKVSIRFYNDHELVSATTQLKKRALILQQFLDKCREKFWNISKIS